MYIHYGNLKRKWIFIFQTTKYQNYNIKEKCSKESDNECLTNLLFQKSF